MLKVVEHAKEGGIRPNEEWQKDSHFIPLPAQFVKAAADQLDNFEIGLIGLTPVNQANFPKTQAEIGRASPAHEKSRAVGDLVC